MSNVPAGTPFRVYLPSSLVIAETAVLITRTRTSPSGKFPSLVMRPVIVPCACAARDEPSARTASADSVQRVRLMGLPPGGNERRMRRAAIGGVPSPRAFWVGTGTAGTHGRHYLRITTASRMSRVTARLGLSRTSRRFSMVWRLRSRFGVLTAALLLGVLPTPSFAQRAAPLPTPESVIGFPVGADYKLFTYDQSIDYFKRLAAASNRVKLITVGKTSFGKTWTAAIISSPVNLANLDRIRAANMRLAHPEGLSEAEARRLASQGRAIVDISGGLHASEIAGSQHTPQAAYELLSRANEPDMKAILDSV